MLTTLTTAQLYKIILLTVVSVVVRLSYLSYQTPCQGNCAQSGQPFCNLLSVKYDHYPNYGHKFDIL